MSQAWKIPTLDMAQQLLADAQSRNPGPWVEHSILTAEAAKIIASHTTSLDPDPAYVMGYLHDIGRREGVTDLRHTLDGYRYLSDLGYEDAARVCLTHSFPVKSIQAGSGQWDCTPDEIRFIQDFLDTVEFSVYDRLIQLCDALALPDGFCIIEKRLVDVAIRRGVNEFTVAKWKVYFEIKKDFDNLVGDSIYKLLPGMHENIFL